MKILFLTDSYPPASLGGYESACWATAEGLRRRGHDTLVLTNGSSKRHTGAVWRGLHYMRDSTNLVEQAWWQIADDRLLEHTLDHFAPDVISVWRMAFFFPSLYVVLRRSRLPTVFNLHDLWLPAHLEAYDDLRAAWSRPGTGALKALAKPLVRWAFGQRSPGFRRQISVGDVGLEHAVFCSHCVRYRHEQAGVPLGDSRVIYNGIDLELFQGEPRAEDGSPAILFVGRLVHEKGAHLAIEALWRLRRAGRRVRLTIAGLPSPPWEYPQSLRDRVRAEGLGDHVTFRDSVSKEALPELYRSHHVLAFPSSAIEGLPLTLLEAMACGTAVVGTTTGGSAELLDDGVNALVCPPHDVGALVSGIERLLDDPGLRLRLAENARGLVRERFGLDRASAETEQYYAEIRALRRQ